MVEVRLEPTGFRKLRKADERLVSYNIEMANVTGGTFWKAYTPEQISGEIQVVPVELTRYGEMMQQYDPVNLGGERIRMLASALGSCYIRVSGGWATGTYYDFDGHTGGEVPEGYQALLTKEQWDGVLDFVRETKGKLMISVSNCKGDHKGGKPWTPEQAKLLFDYSRDYGVPIAAAEFMNEPNFVGDNISVAYKEQDLAKDQDAFYRFVRKNYPEVILAGPCGCGDRTGASRQSERSAVRRLKPIPTERLMEMCREMPDVFSYHCYNGLSERLAETGKGHWAQEEAIGEEYLAVVKKAAGYYGSLRDRFCPGAPLWVTEAGDAGGGGNTWGPTFLDVFRTVNELGSFAAVTDGIIFHNTLASSDYGYLDPVTHLPRPNYWAVCLWNRVMGTTVYDPGISQREGAHIYVHSRRDGRDGFAYAVINNSPKETTVLKFEGKAEVYVLSAEHIRSQRMQINGKTAELSREGTMPEIVPKTAAGRLELLPLTIAYLVI